MSIVEQVRNKNNNQQFVPNREGLAGQFDDSAAYREAHPMRPIGNYPTRVMTPAEGRALEQQALRNRLLEQEIRRIESDYEELGNSGRPTLIRR